MSEQLRLKPGSTPEILAENLRRIAKELSDKNFEKIQRQGWKPISTAPAGKDIALRAYIVPSREAQLNGSRPKWVFGYGRCLWSGHWSGIIGGKPLFWKEGKK